MSLILIKPTEKYRKQITEMLDEWLSVERIDEITPWSIGRLDYHDFKNYCANLDIKEESVDAVPDSTFFCYDEEHDRCVGAVNIRHYLNERLLRNGGHIGDGVRPSERGRGIGTKMVTLALEECRKLGIDRVLMVCEKDNIASAKTIIHNGGILENEIDDDGCTEQRYWIDL